MKTIPPLLIALLSFNVLGQELANEVTDGQVNSYQRAMEAGCKNQGRGKGDPPEKVDALCDCVLKVLKEEVQFSDWQKAYFYSRARNDREEMRILAPHMKKAQVCRTNAL